MYTSSVGSAARTLPAIGRFHLTASPPASKERATVIGWLCSPARTLANKNSFYTWVNCQMTTTTKPGTEMGKITFAKI